MLKPWHELQADSSERLEDIPWLAPRAKIGPGNNPITVDANGQFESTVLFQQGEYPTWKSWDLTNLTQKWVKTPSSNHGVILWATNEDVNAYDLRFYSSENETKQPELMIIWSDQPKTVYFLKDHLGSVRATVLDSAGAPVIGYDDYDPWGYPLGGRTQATPWTSLQAVAKNKFTGFEWDNDLGVNWFHAPWRPYDPEIARWFIIDPVAQYSLSPYVYGANNPLIIIDPFGADTMYVDWPGGKRTAHYIPDIVVTPKPDEGVVRPRPGRLFGLGFLAVGEALGHNDFYRAYTGTDPFSLRQISSVERGMSAGAAALSVVPGGLKPLIKITPKGLAHVIERHAINTISKFAKKSKFFQNVDIPGLIQKANQVDPVPQANGRLAWIVDAGTNIGIDRTTGQSTRIYTVITEGTGDLVSAYPGLP